MRSLRILGLALVALTAFGCARGVTLNPDADQSYAVNVVNDMAHSMIVSYDDGTTTRLLGTVAANRESRFVIAGAARETVTLVATDEAETHTVRRTVTLVSGGTVEVRLN